MFLANMFYVSNLIIVVDNIAIYHVFIFLFKLFY